MKIVVLGSGSILSGAKRNCASYLLHAGGEKFVFDFGTGALKALQRAGENFLGVNNFFFTHFDHPDHVNDFVSLVTARFVAHKYKTGKPKTLNVFAPRGFKKFFAGVKQIYPFLKKIPFKISIKEIAKSEFNFKGLKIISKKVKHTKTSVGYRVSHGKKSFAYSGDTGYCKEIIELCAGADMAVLECSYKNSRQPDTHLNAKTCAKIAENANCRTLVLSHIYPYLENQNLAAQAKKFFRGKVLVARDGMVLNL